MMRLIAVLTLLSGSVFADGVYSRTKTNVSVSSAPSGTVALTPTYVGYGSAAGTLTGDPSMTYVNGVLSTFGLTTTTGQVTLDATANNIMLNCSSGTNRCVNIFDGATNAGKINAAGTAGGIVLASNVGNTGAFIGTADSAGVARGYRTYVGLGVSSGVIISGAGFATPSSTLYVSGTMQIRGINETCNANKIGSYRDVSTLNTIARCNGTSWIALASTTIVVTATTP